MNTTSIATSPAITEKVTRLFISKIISELAHEGTLQPVWQDGNYALHTDDTGIIYRFSAKVYALNHWVLYPDSIEKIVNGNITPLEVISFITSLNSQIGIAPETLPDYMEEVAGTLYGSVQLQEAPEVGYLATADYQAIERAMTGHPRFITNNGRVGFDMSDYHLYAPEAAVPLQLIWLAGHRSRAEFTGSAGLEYSQFIQQELSPADLTSFRQVLSEKGLDVEQYYFIPVHPWQWYNKILHLFSHDIATNLLVCLGYSTDKYQPQQSIRTFFNCSHPEKSYVKTALGILNMGYVRILSPYFMRTTPAINDWVYALVEQDDYLQQHRFCVLREIAAVGYTNQHLEDALKEDSPYKKMLASLWRESPVPKLQGKQRPVTMAALLHKDPAGNALLPELIKVSGRKAQDWVTTYLNLYMKPLLHCFYQYNLVFMPHGENIILVLENNVPVRVIMKDIGEEVVLMDTTTILPEAAKRIMAPVPEEYRTRPLFTQLFDGIFRFIAAILDEQGGLPEQEFWQLTAKCIQEYQQEFPALSEKFRQYDLFTPFIAPDALNRMQIRNSRKLRDRSNPFDVPGINAVSNPIARFKL
ncbi:IucA/IucC family siderophore biosynthesis protein [Chitinophaga sp. Cy-1792]|uniref:IucA/IucC family protein n=1 Tax=Chitinophaga sp. Cy-1792 TaxID=2608339 RepID=UPI00141E8CAF|nr:IucA/IucC family siderophore biosynthesis protein [Chitinophaga sp. Cy-1792]NIG56240.1 IucA/IucC family siderophore biosynthesis protein [Chitinophaga sp. Cy-1792]